MNKIIDFGETIEEYDFKVIDENQARASAGIMFLFGIISLFSIFLSKSLFWAELFSITFIFEFLIRILINPKYAPYMVFGSLFVANQSPTWVEAKPKKFAWILGLILGIIMSYFIIFDIVSPARMLICLVCLVLLFLESSFGICLGCIVYGTFNKELKKCPNDVCSTNSTNTKGKIALFMVYMSMFFLTYYLLQNYKYRENRTINTTKVVKEDKKKGECTPPQWAIDMGHREMWKKHHNCK